MLLFGYQWLLCLCCWVIAVCLFSKASRHGADRGCEMECCCHGG